MFLQSHWDGSFQAADKGQMELYLRWLDKHERQKGEKTLHRSVSFFYIGAILLFVFWIFSKIWPGRTRLLHSVASRSFIA